MSGRSRHLVLRVDSSNYGATRPEEIADVYGELLKMPNEIKLK